MGLRSRNQVPSYRTYGNVAYAPAYDGEALRAPGQGQVLQPKPRHREAVRERQLTRTQVRVREAGQVSPLAVIGFLAVGALAALLLLTYTRYTVVADEVVSLRHELGTLQSENATLSAEYEKVFDMERIQAAVGETMVRPNASQIVYIDLSEPDSVELYAEHSGTRGVEGVLQGLRDIFSNVIEYFR